MRHEVIRGLIACQSVLTAQSLQCQDAHRAEQSGSPGFTCRSCTRAQLLVSSVLKLLWSPQQRSQHTCRW